MSATAADEILPFIPTAWKYTKANSVTFKLRLNPGDNESTTLEKALPILKGTEDFSTVVYLRRELPSVFTGMNCTTGNAMDVITRQVVREQALTHYETFLIAMKEDAFSEAKLAEAERREGLGEDEATIRAALDAMVAPEVTPEQVIASLDEMVSKLAPYKAFPRMKRWLRRKCRKTADTSIRDFYHHLQRINVVQVYEREDLR